MFYLQQILDDIRIDLGVVDVPLVAEPWYDENGTDTGGYVENTEAREGTEQHRGEQTPLYMYPSIRSGPLDVSKVRELYCNKK